MPNQSEINFAILIDQIHTIVKDYITLNYSSFTQLY